MMVAVDGAPFGDNGILAVADRALWVACAGRFKMKGWTILERFFDRTPQPFPVRGGGVYVTPRPEPPRARPRTQAVLSQFFPSSAMFIGNWRATSHLQRRLLHALTTSLAERQLLNQDHASHVRMNELLADRRFLPLPPSRPVCPPEAAISLPLPHLAPSTPEEHQDNARVAVHQAAELASIFDAYWWGCEQAAQLHETASQDSSAFDYEMQERAQIYAAGLGPVARAYLATRSVMYGVDIRYGSVSVVGPGAVGFYAAVAEDPLKSSPPLFGLKQVPGGSRGPVERVVSWLDEMHGPDDAEDADNDD
ncbi:hypothetical protein B0H17DRAFT_1217057 [Mycena rosella]|uniref:Uncharacterized protein n=1 Tax=Mycena rosella TaxID=1033263 RepID=A0AAD7C2U6_MYCRO|nr:hypothetical protein B0H17DRAFT_1217644 [Mycena rosella]KAJ7637501.1 hypothetical protein B0H17DRAFT_1217057 [Mycena rosella]